MDERLGELLATCGAEDLDLSPARWAKKLLELERLDDNWTPLLENLAGGSEDDVPALHDARWETAFEQAAVYFLFRHLPAALEDGDIASKAAFAALSVGILRGLCAGKAAPTPDDLVEFARMYSSEVEYSEENLQTVFDWLYSDLTM